MANMEIDTPMATQDVSSASSSSAAPSPPLSNFDYCMREAQAYKEAGNAALLSGNYQLALGKYFKVQGCTAGLQLPAGLMASQEISMLAAGRQKPSLTPDQEQSLTAFLLTVHLNMAQAYLKLQNWPKVHEMASRVLASDPRNVKALFRRGTSLLHAREYAAAIPDLALAHQLAPTDALIAQHLQHAQKLEQEAEAAADRKLRQQFKGMFSSGQ